MAIATFLSKISIDFRSLKQSSTNEFFFQNMDKDTNGVSLENYKMTDQVNYRTMNEVIYYYNQGI